MNIDTMRKEEKKRSNKCDIQYYMKRSKKKRKKNEVFILLGFMLFVSVTISLFN